MRILFGTLNLSIFSFFYLENCLSDINLLITNLSLVDKWKKRPKNSKTVFYQILYPNQKNIEKSHLKLKNIYLNR